jgi:phosphate starvation-inducible PhoH-like protein
MRASLILLANIKFIHSFVSKYTLTNPKQIKYQKLIQDDKFSIVICNGEAGTGKTMIACHEGIKLLKDNKIDKLVITRPTSTVDGEDLGFLPGKLEEKMHPFILPIYDYLLEYYTRDGINTLINTGKLEIAPLCFMRGRTFKKSFIICDEMQNASKNQMKMLLTRIGEKSKMVITGDIKQSDIGNNNGLTHLLACLKIKYENENFKMYEDGFGVVSLDKSCIQRHQMIEKIIELYEE